MNEMLVFGTPSTINAIAMSYHIDQQGIIPDNSYVINNNPIPRKIPITYLDTDNGTLTGPTAAYMGDTVNLTSVSDEGFELGTITINGEPITGSSFTMPNVTSVSASASFTFTATGYVLAVINPYGSHIFLSGFSGINNPPIISGYDETTTYGTANDVHYTGWAYFKINSAKPNADNISFVYSSPIIVTSAPSDYNSTAKLWRGVSDARGITAHPEALIATAKCYAPSSVITLPLN